MSRAFLFESTDCTSFLSYFNENEFEYDLNGIIPVTNPFYEENENPHENEEETSENQKLKKEN